MNVLLSIEIFVLLSKLLFENIAIPSGVYQVADNDFYQQTN
jgi:hypothetical protein